MDRNTITGLILILLVMVAWAYFSMPSKKELQQQKIEQARKDSLASVQPDSQQTQQQMTAEADSDTMATKQGKINAKKSTGAPQKMGIFSTASQHDTTSLIVETPLYRSKFTNLGAGPATFVLKKYKTWDQKPLQLIKDTTSAAYSTGFLTSQNYNVETDQLLFKRLSPQTALHLQKGDSAQIKYALNVAPGKRILYTYTIHGDSYALDLDITFEGLQRTIIGSTVDFGWKPRLNFTEKNKTQEAHSISAYAYTGGELEELSIGDSGQKEKHYNGTVDWVSTRNKFFTQIIKSESPTESARLVGQVDKTTDNEISDYHYQAYITSNIPKDGTTRYKLFVGPMSYHPLEHFDESTYGMVNVGYSWTRWFSGPLVRYVVIPYFDFMSRFMNLGMAIIIFGILVKMILYPFTKKSYKSMAAMKELQPEMKEIKEKYADDPQKQQKETMKLYKEGNVNPLGGCLPNLLQLPILITLYRFIEHSILIRQASFLWAHDLSTPDYILHLPFNIPFLGDHLAGFVLLMTAAMMVQSQLTGGMGGAGGGGAAGGAGMGKMMQYFFPLMLLFIFNNFAAGLSLYYLIYNVVSICQQLLINKQIQQEKVIAETAPA